MTIAVTEVVVRRADLDRLLAPRRELVLESADGDGGFDLLEGPFRSYRRQVQVEELDGSRVRVRQTVRFELAVPFFGWIFVVPMRRTLARLGLDHRPWWAPPDRLDRRGAEALGLLSAASVIVGFIATLMTQTATFAAAEFGESDTAQGVALGITRVAALLTLPVVTMADRRGRRRIIQVTLLAGPAVAATGAVVPNLAWLAATQTLTRAIALALGITVAVQLAEEMPPRSRAYGVSLVSMAGALGVGLCLFALPLADLADNTWRLVYVLSLLALPVSHRIGIRLPESRRFRAPHPDARFSGHGRRFWLLAASGLLLGLFGAPASQFQNEFLRDELGFSGGRISLFAILTNTPGVIGVVVGGRLADTRGRRRVAAVGLVGGTVATVLMFSSSGWPVWGWSLAGAIVGATTIPAMGVYGPELFPTSLRGRLNGIITLVSVGGSALGLLAVGTLSDRFDAFGPAFAAMALGPLLLAGLVLAAYPETGGHTLEELNPEDEVAG